MCPAAHHAKVRALALSRGFRPPTYHHATPFQRTAQRRGCPWAPYQGLLGHFTLAQVQCTESLFQNPDDVPWPDLIDPLLRHLEKALHIRAWNLAQVVLQGDTPPGWMGHGHYSHAPCDELSSTITVEPSHSLTSSFFAKLDDPVGDDGPLAGWWTSPHAIFLLFARIFRIRSITGGTVDH